MAQANKKYNRTSKISRNLDSISERTKKSQLTFSDLMIPIGSAVILILLTIFVFLPMIRTASEYRKELKGVKEDIAHLEEVKSSLEEIDDDNILDDLVIAKRIIPKVLQVADFVYYIDNLAESKDLLTSDISAGDINVGRDPQKKGGNLGVNSSLSYTGAYDNILDFVDEIQEYSPYLVTLTGMDLSMGSDDSWSVEFDLTGYYIPDREREVDFYSPFTKYTQFSDIIDIFSVRVQKLDEL